MFWFYCGIKEISKYTLRSVNWAFWVKWLNQRIWFRVNLPRSLGFFIATERTKYYKKCVLLGNWILRCIADASQEERNFPRRQVHYHDPPAPEDCGRHREGSHVHQTPFQQLPYRPRVSSVRQQRDPGDAAQHRRLHAATHFAHSRYVTFFFLVDRRPPPRTICGLGIKTNTPPCVRRATHRFPNRPLYNWEISRQCVYKMYF